ncbi:MAG TPA: outer membrane protein transport protein [Candidatus Omnitrophota bacterium]|nr:outer membrane protein transport protein [Candidatus Omnitrophota bacterium]HPS37285.1 outer membrane protein transport protein [Candidatus Omnitrophota bacterium]
MSKKLISLVTALAVIFMTPATAFAVGGGSLENASFSGEQLGLSGAVTATADEPAAISYNPAGIVNLPGIQVQGDANFLSSFTFKTSDTTGSTRSTGTLHFVPTGYLTINPGEIFCDRVAFGIGTDSPFGLANQYDSMNPAVHYTGWANYLKMYTIKPVMAVKVTDWLDIGGGPMWYRIYDFGAVQAYPNNLIFPYTWPDGQVRINLSGQHWGWQMGALVKPTKKHRFGFYFRSPVVVNVSGLGKVENSSFYPGGSYETGVHSKVPLPMNLTWAYAYQPTDKTHYEVDFTYNHWSTTKRLCFPADPTPSAADNGIMSAIGTADKDWGNSYGIQIGASHKFTKKLTGRCGSFFYWTPIPKTSFSPAVPDANRLSLSLGAGYAISKYLTADIAYYNSFYFRRRINNSYPENAVWGSSSSVDGTYFSYLQAFTVSLTAHWDDIFPRADKDKGTQKDVPAPSIEMTPIK